MRIGKSPVATMTSTRALMSSATNSGIRSIFDPYVRQSMVRFAPSINPARRSSSRPTPPASLISRVCASVPLLRRTHDDHRDLRARRRAQASPHACPSTDQNRHLMTPSPPIKDRSDAHHSCWLSAGSVKARSGLLDSPVVAPILSFNAPTARSHRRANPCCAANPSRQPLQSKLRTPGLAAKSP